MAVCIACSQKSHHLGELCSCGAGYTVHDDHGKDPMGILGTLLDNKLVPTAVLGESSVLVRYEAFQPNIDRTVTLLVIKPKLANSPAIKTQVLSIIDKCVNIKQQNTPNFLEVIELPQFKCFAVSLDATKGELLPDYLHSHPLDPVAAMHIIHQILQSVAAHHKLGICFPNISTQNVRIYRSGTDNTFVKLTDLINLHLLMAGKPCSKSDDVFSLGQLALSLITGQKPPIKNVELPPDKAYLMPIAQLFMKAIAPVGERFESSVEMLHAFELAFDLGSHDNASGTSHAAKAVAAKEKDKPKHQTPVPFEQVIWMHRPPHIETH